MTEQERAIGDLQEFVATMRSRNSQAIERRLDDLDESIDTDSVREAIEEYRGILREDYSDAEEYSDARTDAWDAIVEAVDNLEPAEEEEEEPTITEAITGITHRTGYWRNF